ncbi:MAG: capsule assembly Wzi family protein [Lutibacter sp.]|uniref:capsule assembly Wzi family protein n=1 Tax=Lutibacter sp. TaxID=1925666 RepID=UPI00299D1C9C|nr:capsule assembly Wzi family protein [Lutibacter sp.]MDX1828800.1 capsule assembly Wzi family protein [Lutibacter sp.]
MKQRHLVSLIIFLSIVQYQIGFSQNSTNYSIALNGAATTKNTLPFWLTANTFGTVPNTDFASVNTSFFGEIPAKKNSFNFEYKASFTGFLSPSKKIMINELYGTLQFKKWHITLGNKNDAIQWEGLSSSNGNILKSTNTRALPGINIASNAYIKLPFAKNWLSIKFNYAEYLMNDKRIVNHVHLHHKSLYFKSSLNSKLAVITGLDHYVQWGGTSPIYGKQPSGLKDYIKIITGSSGGTSASEGDQINALGNTIGAYLLQLNYKGLKTNWNFYYSHPFEDRSGREMQNWRDGLYGVFVDLNKPKSFINQVLLEFTYTKHMSGANAPDDANGGRGRDNYFNNFVYNSGWTYYGNTIGSPYFTATPLNEEGVSNGIILGDNRFIAFNFGWNGNLHNLKYKAIFSHATYVGWFDYEYHPQPKQFSGFLAVTFPKLKNLPFTITVSSSFDTGTYRPVNFGGFIKLSKTGFF